MPLFFHGLLGFLRITVIGGGVYLCSGYVCVGLRVAIVPEYCTLAVMGVGTIIAIITGGISALAIFAGVVVWFTNYEK